MSKSECPEMSPAHALHLLHKRQKHNSYFKCNKHFKANWKNAENQSPKERKPKLLPRQLQVALIEKVKTAHRGKGETEVTSWFGTARAHNLLQCLLDCYRETSAGSHVQILSCGGYQQRVFQAQQLDKQQQERHRPLGVGLRVHGLLQRSQDDFF